MLVYSFTFHYKTFECIIMQLLQVFWSEYHSNVFYILKEYCDLFFTSRLANLRVFPGASDTCDNHIIYKSIWM